MVAARVGWKIEEDSIVVFTRFTINELLSGKRLTQDEYKIAAEENLRQVVKASSFTLEEKIAFYKKKWLKEHIAAMCCWGIGIVTVLVVGIILSLPILVSADMLLLLVGHAWRNNTMMAYVERNAFDGTGRNDWQIPIYRWVYYITFLWIIQSFTWHAPAYERAPDNCLRSTGSWTRAV